MIRLDDAAGEDRSGRFEPLSEDLQTELIETAEHLQTELIEAAENYRPMGDPPVDRTHRRGHVSAVSPSRLRGPPWLGDLALIASSCPTGDEERPTVQHAWSACRIVGL